MTSLQEDLPALAAAANEITGAMAGLIGRGKEVESAANALLGDVEEHRSASVELFAQVLHALSDLEASVRAQDAGLAEDVAETTAGLGRALDGLESQRGDVEHAVDGAESALAELQRELSASADATRAAAAGCGDAVSLVEGTAYDVPADLADALDGADAVIDALLEAVRAAQASVGQGVHALGERMRGLLDEGRREVESTEQTLRSSLAAHQSHLAEEGGRLRQGAEDLLADLRQRVTSDVKGRVAEAIDGALGALAVIAHEAAAAAAGVHREADELQSGIEMLGAAMEPLPAAVDAVREAAAQVGLPWS